MEASWKFTTPWPVAAGEVGVLTWALSWIYFVDQQASGRYSNLRPLGVRQQGQRIMAICSYRKFTNIADRNIKQWPVERQTENLLWRTPRHHDDQRATTSFSFRRRHSKESIDQFYLKHLTAASTLPAIRVHQTNESINERTFNTTYDKVTNAKAQPVYYIPPFSLVNIFSHKSIDEFHPDGITLSGAASCGLHV